MLEQPSYVSGKWKQISPEAKVLVQSTIARERTDVGMLMKDPEQRVTLKELLTHPWIAGGGGRLESLRRNATSEAAFKVFSQQKPNSLKMYDEVSRMKDRAASP
ncbi:MAG: hypothetical protein P4M11_12125 [Candidatus Pacebacteria bacterium]|nr:hypothetical protein [Candidatus Paceibacterota bacterium]